MLSVLANQHHANTRSTVTPLPPTNATANTVPAALPQMYEEACASATESTPEVEKALFWYAGAGDVARLMALLERQIANLEAKGQVRGKEGGG